MDGATQYERFGALGPNWARRHAADHLARPQMKVARPDWRTPKRSMQVVLQWHNVRQGCRRRRSALAARVGRQSRMRELSGSIRFPDRWPSR